MKHFLLSIILLIGIAASAQPALDWVGVSTNANFEDYVEDVYVDAAGNTYACGTFKGAMTIGGDNLFASGGGQAFAVKYDPSGNPLWARQSQGAGNNNKAFGKSIFADALGNVYVAGYHSHGTINWAGINLSSSSNEGFYIVKLTPNGTPIHMTGPTFASLGKSQAWSIDGDGPSVYVTGSHRGALSLPGGPTLPAPQGQSDMFLAKVDSALSSFTFAVSHGGTSDDLARSLKRDGNNIYVTGVYGPAECTFFDVSDFVLPNYGNQSVWLTRFNGITGSVDWATSLGSSNGSCTANDVYLDGGQLYIVGGCPDSTIIVESPSPTGPFTYNDTIFSNGGLDAYVVRYDQGGVLQTKWKEGGFGDDEAFGITRELACSQILICGSFEDSVNFGGTTPLIANDKSCFVASTNNSGNLNWVIEQISDEDITPTSIATSNGITSVGGIILGDGFFYTDPMTLTSHNGYQDHFVFSFDCTNPPPCGVSIDQCASNDTVVASFTCQHTLGDYTAVPFTDGCGTGNVTVSQNAPPLSILGPGVHEVNLTATDLIGTKDVCFFEVVVKAISTARVASCGSVFTGETTGSDGDQYNSFSCSSTTTPGQDAFYQVTVDAGIEFIQVEMTNVVDANDPYAYVYWLSNNCPSSATCLSIDSLNVSSGKFSNNSAFMTFTAPAPGTYFFVVDAVTDSIESYDIAFYCATDGIDFDVSCPADLDNDGIIPYVNGSDVDLTVQPCESVNICNDILIENATWEWMDSVILDLGDCYENINTATLTPDLPALNTGFVDVNGEWDASYNAGSNSILWTFDHSSGNEWGDGNSDNYDCSSGTYTFCFDADITAACSNSSDLNIGIKIGDDREKNGGQASNFFLVSTSNNFVLQDDDPFFSYASNVLCNIDPNEVPDSITTGGGQFTASPGIVFTDGSPSATGEIDLTASSIGGPYTITYTVGLCPYTHDFILDINAQEDPAFNYDAAAYCQGDTDPIANITGTNGGLFSGPPEIVFVDNATGEIDLDASTVGGPYYIVYTTPGPFCVNADSVQVTINAEDDPTFNYAVVNHCKDDANVTPVSIITSGGTFSEYTGNLSINSVTGEVDISASLNGGYYVVYTTSGICPNVDSVQFNVLPEDNPSFNYASSSYCQFENNPVATITGTGGGTFTGPAGVSFVNSATGEIDLIGSTTGGPYWIVYTTPGPICINTDSVEVTINAEDDSSFTYPSSIICLADSNPIPTITGTSGGTFTVSGGIVFTDGSPSPTGEIDILASTIGGPYTVTYTTPGPECPNSDTFQVSIYAEDDPTISYDASSYCQNETNPVATIATPGGTFTGPVSFVNTTTGEIDLTGSPPGGPYQIVYTSPGPECPNTDTVFVTINSVDDASFTYGNSEFCVTDLIISPVINGTPGGEFSTADTSILKLDTLSGDINLQTSTAGGPYIIQYATTGACPDTTTDSITIYLEPISEAGPDQNLYFLYETKLAAVDPPSGTGVWSILSGSGNITDVNDFASTITDLENGTTTLQWTVSNGVCPVAIDEMIIVVSDLFIPEAITPNNDGSNDLFVIEGIDLLENTVEIFNRWGQVVYSATNYQNDWDGTDASGKELVEDTYFYIIEAKDIKFKGYVVIKR